MFNHKVIYKSVNSDCTTTYHVLVEENLSVHYFIKNYILKNKKEFGTIGILSILGDNEHTIQYAEGKILKGEMTENERYFWRSIENYNVIQIYANCGCGYNHILIKIQSR